jgi:thioredoxin-related protein
MKSIKLLLLITALTISALQAQDDQIVFEESLWEEVKEKANSEGKLIFVDAYTTWCGPCKWMAKEVFTNTEVANFYNTNFVNIKIDMEKGEGIDLAKQWGVKAYPSLLYFDGEGNLMHRLCGALDAMSFIEAGNTALDPEQRLENTIRTHNENPEDIAFFANYLLKKNEACMDVQKESKEYFASVEDESLLDEINWKLIEALVKDADSREFLFLENNYLRFLEVHGEAVDNKIYRVYFTLLNNEISGKNKGKNYPAMRKQMLNKDIAPAEKAVLSADMRLYSSKKDWKNYVLSADNFIEKYEPNNANLLNNIAWNIYENCKDKTLLEKALTWSKTSVALDENYYNTDTYAHLLYKTGNNAMAAQMANRAIELAEQNGEDADGTKELIEKIEKAK